MKAQRDNRQSKSDIDFLKQKIIELINKDEGKKASLILSKYINNCDRKIITKK